MTINSDVQIMRRPDVAQALGISIPTLDRWQAKGIFPRPIQLGPQAVGWRKTVVLDWLNSREAA